jgi:hypothetical protein
MIDFCDERELGYEELKHSHYISHGTVYKHIEFQIAEKSPAVAAYLANPKSYSGITFDGMLVATPEMLYSLKRSHRFLARHWEKHIRDYHILKTLVSGVDIMPEITKLKSDETKHTKKPPSLNKTKDEFFKDDVSNHTFEHDDIHRVMAHRERPMFEYIEDSLNGTVKSSKEKFFQLTREEQIQCVLEEAYVIALERGILPMLYEGKKLADAKTAIQWSLMRICTTLTSGWFREFAVENYPYIVNSVDPRYVEKFLYFVDSGQIKRIIKL